MTRRVLWIVPFLLLTACARGGDSSSSPQAGAAPFGLGTVTWPIDVNELDGIFAALPDEISGQPRLDGGFQTAIYGEGKDRVATIYAVDLGAAACPGMSGGSLVRSTLEQRGGELKIDQQSPDQVPDGTPAFLVGRREGQQVVAWSVPGAHWVIAIEATSPEARDAASAAVVVAAASASVTASVASPSTSSG
jgi:hypothetical protein